MNWLYYLAEANAYLAVIYGIYYLALRRETFYQLNRVYLLTGSVLAFIIPFLQLGILRPAQQSALDETTPLTTQLAPAHTLVITDVAPVQQQPNYLLWAYCVVALIMLMLFVNKLVHLLLLAQKGKRQSKGQGFRLIELETTETPAFSFFNYLFISTSVNRADTIIRHELVHIRQKHSWDVVFMELFKVINWFNPVVYLMQNSLKELHEYIADEQLGQTRQEINDYTDFLISNAYGAQATSLTNNFFHKNLLKKRIIMLHKQRSGYLARLKYLLIVPVCLGLMCSSTLAFSKSYGFLDLLPQKDTLKLKQPPKVVQLRAAKETVLPPPPPASPTLKAKTSKGFKYQQDGYVTKNGNDFRVIITEKDGSEHGYFKSKSSEATLKMLKDKYGYTFPTMQLHSKLPPPPPMAPAKSPGPVKFPPSAKLPVIPGVELLYKQVAKKTLYPAQARENNIGGRVFALFTVDNYKKVNAVKILRSPSKQLSEEVARVLSNCTDLDGLNPGDNYVIPVSFSIKDGNENYLPTKTDDTATAAVTYGGNIDASKKGIALNEVVVVGYPIQR